jgi:hypothetical protein
MTISATISVVSHSSEIIFAIFTLSSRYLQLASSNELFTEKMVDVRAGLCLCTTRPSSQIYVITLGEQYVHIVMFLILKFS